MNAGPPAECYSSVMENALSKVTPLHDGDAGYRMPPQNLAAEQALLGAILQNNNVYKIGRAHV